MNAKVASILKINLAEHWSVLTSIFMTVESGK